MSLGRRSRNHEQANVPPTVRRAAGCPLASHLFGRASGGEPKDEPLRNWAGNLQYGTDRLYRAGSVDQIQDLVKKHDKVKVLGTRHCFNGIADSTDNLISLRQMDRVVALDPKARTVTVEAGMSYGQLCPYLHDKGFALHNLASLPHISVAGAIATATHGSGVKNGNLATAVSALEFVTAAGDVLNVARDKDGKTFSGAVVNLGALGVVTKVTLDVQPAYRMRQDVYEDLPMAQLKDHLDDIVSSGYSVSLFTDWQQHRINEVWIKRRVEKGAAPDAEPEFYGAKLATKNLHPIAELSAENCTEQMGVPGPWYERLPHFRMGFTPSSGKELQSEYFVPRQQRRRSHPRGRATARPGQPAPDDFGAAHHRRGPVVDESLLQATEPGDPLHLETGLGGRQQGAADHRKGTGAVRGPAALGKTVHPGARAIAIALRNAVRIQATGQGA